MWPNRKKGQSFGFGRAFCCSPFLEQSHCRTGFCPSCCIISTTGSIALLSQKQFCGSRLGHAGLLFRGWSCALPLASPLTRRISWGLLGMNRNAAPLQFLSWLLWLSASLNQPWGCSLGFVTYAALQFVFPTWRVKCLAKLLKKRNQQKTTAHQSVRN